MNVKKSAKKVFAVAAGLALVGTTVMGALAYDLSDYPAPFVEDGMAKGVIVVGANAATSDVLGAIDIAASLQAVSTSEVEIPGSAGVTVEGGEEIEDVALHSVQSGSYDDSDLEGFRDSDSELNDIDWDYIESVSLSGVNLSGSYLNSWDEEENYGTDVYMELTENGVKYGITFDSAVTQAAFTADSNGLEIPFLGKTITVTDVDDSGSVDTITVEASDEFYMEQGDAVTIEGHEITLKKVGESSALVEVDGQIKSISCSSGNEEFEDADDFEVEVDSCFYIEGATDNSATLTMGSSISETYEHGKPVKIFGGSDDDDEATWVWDLDVDGTDNLVYMGVMNNQKYEKVGVTDANDRGALAMGESLDFPNGYASLEFADWSEIEMSRSNSLELDFDNDDKVNADAVSAANPALGSDDFLVFASDSDDDDFVIVYQDGSTKKAEEVQVAYDTNTYHVFFDDGDDEYYAGEFHGKDANAAAEIEEVYLQLDTEKVQIVFDDDATFGLAAADIDDTLYDGTDFMHLSFGGIDHMTFDLRDNKFGANANEAETGDFAYADSSAATRTINGKFDEEVMTEYGVTFDDVEAMLDSDEFEMVVPHAQLKGDIVVKSKGSVVSAGSDGGMSYDVNPIALGLGVLDTDATLGSKPMIIVGGPMANTVAAEFLGNPTNDQIMETFEAGKALIKYDDANKAMLVAGWDKQETLGASYVVSKYGSYDFAGDELEVVVTDLSNIEVTAVE